MYILGGLTLFALLAESREEMWSKNMGHFSQLKSDLMYFLLDLKI